VSPAPSSSVALPTRSEIEAWSTTELATAAASWRTAATESEDAFDQHRQNIASPGGTTWEGDAKDAALDRVTNDIGVVGNHGVVLREAAGIAEGGVGDIDAAKREVIDAITEAEDDGFRVGEDLSVTDTRKVDLANAQARYQAAAEHAEDIGWYAERLVQADNLVGERLKTKAGELEGIRFEGEGHDSDQGHVQLVSNEIKLNPQDQAAGDGKDRPGSPPAGLPQVGPFPVPKEVADAAKKPDPKAPDPKTPDPTGLGGLLGANDPPEGKPGDGHPDEPGDPKPGGLPGILGNVQPPITPKDHPQPAPAQPPKLDPAQLDTAKAAARQVLVNEGVPPDQIEQRLNAMVADAQKPLAQYTPPPDEPGPKPSYSDGFGDAWHRAEDGAHDLVGYNGFENFKDAWKNLGSGIVDTVSDPYGTAARSVVDEFNAAKANPEYWLGQKGFDVAAGAATLPFGGEGALARGALDDVAGHAIPHEVIDSGGPGVTHHPPISVDHPMVGDHPAHPFGDTPMPADSLPDLVPLPDTGPYHLPDPVQLTTPPDGATFWSGRNADGMGIGPISAGGNGAADLIAGGHRATTLEGLLDANGIQPPKWSPTDVHAENWWSAVSQIYAENASGEVRAVVGPNLRPGNVWENVELPRLMDNPNVAKIIVIDPDTGIETTVFQR
jgi:hypothetical protein